MSEQSPELPPAQPIYILRGHAAQIHAVHFFRHNTHLVSGDADGWAVVWNLPIRRPAAVWRPHKNTILGMSDWDDDKILTHGRDGELCVWQFREADETVLSKALPIDGTEISPQAPWLLHSLKVHALNFCSFASCMKDSKTSERDLVVAVPGLQDGSINLTDLPSEQRMATIPPPKDVKTGMLMAIGLHAGRNGELPVVFAGYESGHTAVWKHNLGGTGWQTIYVQQAHSQPILSLGVAPELRCFFTSSADAIIARYAIRGSEVSLEAVQTRHAGQQSLAVRSDEKIIATAGWDGRMRVYSAKTVQELAVLKWHKQGCYACAFAEVHNQSEISATSLVDSRGQTPTVAERRVQATANAHWIAAGSKDGRVSLWQVY